MFSLILKTESRTWILYLFLKIEPLMFWDKHPWLEKVSTMLCAPHFDSFLYLKYYFYHKIGFNLSFYISSKRCLGENKRRVLLYPCSVLTKQYITKSCKTLKCFSNGSAPILEDQTLLPYPQIFVKTCPWPTLFI